MEDSWTFGRDLFFNRSFNFNWKKLYLYFLGQFCIRQKVLCLAWLMNKKDRNFVFWNAAEASVYHELESQSPNILCNSLRKTDVIWSSKMLPANSRQRSVITLQIQAMFQSIFKGSHFRSKCDKISVCGKKAWRTFNGAGHTLDQQNSYLLYAV